jgi:F-type H+-transporting ATPase subunit gamma
VIKRAERAMVEQGRGRDVALTLVGRKAGDYFRRHHRDAISKLITGIARVEYGHAVGIAAHVAERYERGEADRVLLVNSEFVSTMTQMPRVTQLLPFRAEEESSDAQEARLPYRIEPSPQKLLETLVPKALEVQIFRALLENQAGEHAARMTAMESATRNTEELIESLTLQYNRARQAAITRELVEIVSGAEAL